MTEYLGKYRIDSVLGKGAMGVVYKAFDPFIERVVALKTIRKELFSDAEQDEIVGRFKKEAQAAGRLNHPNIVAVYDYGEDPDSAYIAMEFVDGTPLNTLMVADRPTAPARVASWMADLLRALAYAHERGVVHRDIKPANLLITHMAQVKISDFGIARIESSTLTQVGSMIGTPSYMSPEQIRGATVDGRSDLFSAGIVLYQLLTGVRPFTGSTAVVMQQILSQEPAPPSSLNSALSPAFDRVMEKAIAKVADDRFASAQAFLQALETAQREGDFDPDATTLAIAEHTLMVAQVRLDMVAATPPTYSVGTSSSSGIETVTPWKQEAFAELESVLSRQIGPIAKLLLKKTASKAEGIDELCESLLAHIPSEVGRVQFQSAVAGIKKKLLANGTATGNRLRSQAISGSGLNPPAWAVNQVQAPVIFDAAYADAMTQRLTVFIGPIAKVVVKRALRQTNDKTAFLDLLAEHIEVPAERSRFLSEAKNA